jgi:transcriptional regulator with XRE-family HTH domain
MAASLRVSVGNLVRATRIQLDITQHELARSVGVTRAYVSAIELGRANPTIDVVQRIALALGLELEVAARRPAVIGAHQRDIVHARCSAYVHRRLQTRGFDCLREAEIAHGRSHGWIDLIAFDRATGTLYVIEVKTTLADIGAVERQLAWYERAGPDLAAGRGWRVRRVRTWLLILASEDVERSIRINREVLRVAFPIRAVAMRRLLVAAQPVAAGSEAFGHGLALIDPSSRRRDWLLASRVDGRRGLAPFRDYADAASRWRNADRSTAKPEDARSARMSTAD